MVRDGEVKHPLYQQRIGFDPPALPGLLGVRHSSQIHPMGPHHGKRSYVGLVDLRKRAVTLARIVAIERGPGVGRQCLERRGIEQLAGQTGREQR